MGRRGPKCTICQHEERWRIELLKAGGASLDSLAEKFAISRDALHRHWRDHVTAEEKAKHLIGPAKLADLAATAANEGASVLDYLRIVRTTLLAQLSATSEAGDARGVAIVASQLITVLEKIGKLTGEIATLAAGSIHVTNNFAIVEHPQFIKAQAAMLQALAPFPDARAAVVLALRALEPAGPLPEAPRGAAPLLIEARPNG